MLGVLEIAGRGSGFLRRREAGYLPANGDVHVGERLIRQHSLRPGDEIDGETRPGGKGRGPTLEKVRSVNGRPPADLRARTEFSRLSAIHPNEQLRLKSVRARRSARGRPLTECTFSRVGPRPLPPGRVSPSISSPGAKAMLANEPLADVDVAVGGEISSLAAPEEAAAPTGNLENAEHQAAAATERLIR